MKRKVFSGVHKNLMILGAGLLLLGAGFLAGRSAQAEATTPGTASDPLVSQSYVQSQVAAKTQALQQKINLLEEKSARLEAQIKELEQ